MSEPKTVERRIAFRKANRRMTSKRIDLPLEKVSYLNPEVLAKFTSETGKILPRRVTGVSAKDASSYQSRNQACTCGELASVAF